jgi:hypothetical protein
MKKIVLSGLAALTIGTVGAQATQFYTDANGQVFTSAAEGRTPLEISEALMPSKKKSLTIVDEKSPEFILGKQTHINMKIVADDNSDMWLKAGVRIQGTFETKEKDYFDNTRDVNLNDAYLRRVRFEVAAGFNKWTSFVMDVRNDKANYEQEGEKTFNVGDAYVQIKKPFDTSLVNFKLFRAKIDVSRTETSKSAFTVHYDRPHVADEAAQYITHNRRGTNAQMYGDWEKKVHYQVAFGDGVDEDTMVDATGKKYKDVTGNGVVSQDFFFGGKVKFSPFDGWEEKKVTETYFGQGQHFTVGAAYWRTNNIKTKDTVGTLDHELMNLELSAHYGGLSMSAEYFAFDGVVKQWGATETGKSDGWYALAEYVFTDLGYVAPFVRYESWDKYKDAAAGEDYGFTSTVAGVNWYLMGNSIKAGFAYQKDEYGTTLREVAGKADETRFKVTTQFFF